MIDKFPILPIFRGDIIEIGEKLIDVKERLPHGEFGGWLEAEFEWDTRQAQRFINVASEFGGSKSDNLSFFAPSALYLLAAPSTPDDARAEAIERAEDGEQLRTKRLKKTMTKLFKLKLSNNFGACDRGERRMVNQQRISNFSMPGEVGDSGLTSVKNFSSRLTVGGGRDRMIETKRQGLVVHLHGGPFFCFFFEQMCE